MREFRERLVLTASLSVLIALVVLWQSRSGLDVTLSAAAPTPVADAQPTATPAASYGLAGEASTSTALIAWQPRSPAFTLDVYEAAGSGRHICSLIRGCIEQPIRTGSTLLENLASDAAYLIEVTAWSSGGLDAVPVETVTLTVPTQP